MEQLGDYTPLYYVLTAVIVIVAWRFLSSSKNLPPGPRGWPIVGQLPNLGTHPHKSLAKMAEKYGPLMYLKLGQKGCIVASSPDMAKEFLKIQDANFSARPHTAQGDILFYNRQGIASQSNTPGWRHLRKLFQVELTGPKRLEASKHVRSEEVAYMLKTVAQEGLVEIREQLSIMTSNIISRMVLNKRYVAMTDAKTVDRAEAQEFREMIEEIFVLTGSFNIGDFIPALKWLDLQGYEGRMKKIRNRLDKFVLQIIAEHRARRQRGPVSETEKDMVHVLLDELESSENVGYQITEANVKSIILDAFIAATDTMIVTSDWAMSEVIRNPWIMKKAVAELDAVVGKDRMVQESDLPQLKFIQAIIKETFRLHATGPLLIPHEATEACKACGYDIPAKTQLLVNVHAIGRDASIWKNPLEFNPNRFMEGRFAKIEVRGLDFELTPFGSGRRMCPAMPMAYLVVQFSVASLLHAFNWSLPDRMDPKDMDMSEGVGLSVPRAVALRAIAEPRLSLHLYE